MEPFANQTQLYVRKTTLGPARTPFSKAASSHFHRQNQFFKDIFLKNENWVKYNVN
jgi:hypothetical protein